MRHILRAQEAVGLMAVSRMCLECSRPEFWFLLGSLANHQAILIAWLQDTNAAKDEYMSKVRLLVMAYALVFVVSCGSRCKYKTICWTELLKGPLAS